MNLLIFGATGGTGRAIVAQALEQGHGVTAFARNPAAITTTHENLAVVHGDILDYASVERAVKGQDAVLSALGTKAIKRNTTISDGTRNIITAMEKYGVKRLVFESSLGIGDSKPQRRLLPLPYSIIVMPLLFRNLFQDKETQEGYIMQSTLEWVIVRPAVLTNGPRTGVYRSEFSATDSSIKAKISRADVADFMLKQLTDDTYVHKTPSLSY
jgi:putative NADH-flavin reductase